MGNGIRHYGSAWCMFLCTRLCRSGTDPCYDKTWKKSYINLLINSLLKKDMIKVVGVKQMTKNYARTFVPTMTKDAYAIKQISDRPNFADSDIPTLFSELIEKTESSEIFDKLEALLKKRREELGK